MRKFAIPANRQGFAAILLLPVLLGTVSLANMGAVAEQAAAGSTRMFAGSGPGAMGQIRFALAGIGVGKVVIDPKVARSALSSAPLSSDPFTALAAIDFNANPRGSRADAVLLAEAVSRNPRSRAARILSLRMMAANGDLKGAFDQLAVFNRLNPGLVDTIMEAITVRVQSPRQVDEAIDAIGPHSELYLPFVSHLNGKKKPPAVTLRLAERLPAKIVAIPQVRAAVVNQLVDADQISVARNLWQQGIRSNTSGFVHSPNFMDTKVPPPFNWKLVADTTGAAERAAGGGVSVIYYDRQPGYIVSQLITLPPGGFRVFADFEVTSGQSNNVRLRLACQESGQTLGEAALTQTKPGLNRIGFGAVVPLADCTGQILSIVGVASDERGETQIIIRRVDVQSANSRP